MKKVKKDLPILLALDPSIRSMGWATVNLNRAVGNDYYDLENAVLWNYGLVTMEATKQIQYRWEQAARQLEEAFELDEIRPTHLASEWPTFFDSMKGRIAAQENYTIGMASMVGFLGAYFDIPCHHIILWTPQQWKGTTPKQVTRNQFALYFGDTGKRLAKAASDDVIDAIMIARLWLTLYDREKFYWQHNTEREEHENIRRPSKGGESASGRILKTASHDL